MNQTQRNYAIKRVEQMVQEKKEEIKRKHTTPATQPTLDDVYDALKSGKAKLKSKKAVRERVEGRFEQGRPREMELNQVFNGLPEKKKGSCNQAAIDAEYAELNDKSRAVIDEIMLGDEATAMKLLADFEKELAKK